MVLVSLSERLVTGLPGIGAQFSTEKALPWKFYDIHRHPDGNSNRRHLTNRRQQRDGKTFLNSRFMAKCDLSTQNRLANAAAFATYRPTEMSALR